MLYTARCVLCFYSYKTDNDICVVESLKRCFAIWLFTVSVISCIENYPPRCEFWFFVFVQLITDNNIVFVMSNMAIFINVCFQFSWYTMTSPMSIMDITRIYVKYVYFINICFEFSWYIMTSTMSIFDMIRRYAQSDFIKRSPLLCFGMEIRGPFY